MRRETGKRNRVFMVGIDLRCLIIYYSGNQENTYVIFAFDLFHYKPESIASYKTTVDKTVASQKTVSVPG